MAEPRPHNSRLLPRCLLRRRLARIGPAHGLLQLNGVVKASGARAELEGVARVYDFPSSPRCVDVRVAASDAVKASHIQRSPLSMGGLRELGVACSRNKKNRSELLMRKNATMFRGFLSIVRHSYRLASYQGREPRRGH